jgi:carboxymethylenebutenolidase
MFEARHLQYNLISGYIQIVSDGHYLPAFWSHPDIGDTFPGLVLLHDYWGLTAHVRSLARRFAELGYYVIAPDLFGGQTARSLDEAQNLASRMGAVGLSHVTATLHALNSHHKCNGKIGVLGWGMGAGLALNTAVLRDDLRALVIFYGLPDNILPAEFLMLSCPLLGLFAAKDAATPPEVLDRLRQVLAQTELPHEVIVYPDVDRGFFDDTRPTFQATAAEDAWKHALDYLNTRLDVAPPTRPGEFKPGRIY